MIRLIIVITLVYGFPSNSSANLFSQLDLRMFDDGQFTLVIDNQPYNTPSNRFFLKNLLPGNHFLQVTRTLSHSGPFNNYGSPYFYSGLISVPYNVKIQAFIDSYRVLNVISIVPFGCGDDPLDYNVPLASNSDNIFDRKFILQDSTSYKELMNYVQSQGSSRVRLVALKRAIIPNKIASIQVAELMKLLDFDSERLEFARFAYYFTADRYNYFRVRDSFIFSSTANELSNHLFDYN
ncbi:MAG TPA: DUF4476 domain-containing protein [Cytophagaceae bacterium]|jgi:hypothetical protein